MNTRILRFTSTIFALFFLLCLKNNGLAQDAPPGDDSFSPPPKGKVTVNSSHAKDTASTKIPATKIAGSKSQQGLTPEKADSLRPSYKFLPEAQAFFSPYYSISEEAHDHLYHRHAEDYFVEQPHIYLRDKVELGQLNELLVGGLGTRYQSVLLDEALLNDPITMAAVYQQLSSESFSSLNLHTGYTSLAYSSAPITLQSTTQRLVAGKGYTKITYFQFANNTLKTDLVFSINLSERLNFYLNYGRESTDGGYSNTGGSGKDLYGSSYEANKFNIQFRYQLGSKTYLTLAEYYNALVSKPFGGVDYENSVSFDLDPFDSRSAIIRNQFTRRTLLMNVLRAEIQTALPVFSDTSNVFKAWGYMANFNNEFRKDNVSLQDLEIFHDKESSVRWSVGGTQLLKLPFLLLNVRGEYLYDIVQSQNTLVNSDSVSINPSVHTIALNSGARLKFDRLVFGRTLEAGGSLGLTTKSVQNTDGEDYATTFLSTGFGGEVNFPLGFLGEECALKFFATASTTQRVPSLQEVFASDTTLLGSHQWEDETIQHIELGTTLSTSDDFSLSVSFMHNRVSSPTAVVQTVASDGSTTTQFRSLKNEALSYSGIGISAKARLWKLDATIQATAALNYNILSSPDRDYADTLASGSSSADMRTGKLFYLPKLYCAYELYYRDKLFSDALNLKVGFAGFLTTGMSASLQNSERQNIFYFNLIEQDGALRDNNLQFGVQGLKTRVDFRLWAEVGSATFTIFFENLLNEKVFKAPLFPMYDRSLRIGISWRILD
ncbi:MAG: putative porin [Chlorobiales bacterium]|nr:putative porin [Chlorobiales bacterium]